MWLRKCNIGELEWSITDERWYIRWYRWKYDTHVQGPRIVRSVLKITDNEQSWYICCWCLTVYLLFLKTPLRKWFSCHQYALFFARKTWFFPSSNKSITAHVHQGSKTKTNSGGPTLNNWNLMESTLSIHLGQLINLVAKHWAKILITW